MKELELKEIVQICREKDILNFENLVDAITKAYKMGYEQALKDYKFVEAKNEV